MDLLLRSQIPQEDSGSMREGVPYCSVHCCVLRAQEERPRGTLCTFAEWTNTPDLHQLVDKSLKFQVGKVYTDRQGWLCPERPSIWSPRRDGHSCVLTSDEVIMEKASISKLGDISLWFPPSAVGFLDCMILEGTCSSDPQMSPQVLAPRS